MNAPAQLPLPPSLYADTAVAPTPTPQLTGDKNVSVAIIGGGFTGLSTALHLAEQGIDVTVLEAQQPGWGASGRNGGQINTGLRKHPLRVDPQAGQDVRNCKDRTNAHVAPPADPGCTMRWKFRFNTRVQSVNSPKNVIKKLS